MNLNSKVTLPVFEILALLANSCMTLDNSLIFLVPQFPPL